MRVFGVISVCTLSVLLLITLTQGESLVKREVEDSDEDSDEETPVVVVDDDDESEEDDESDEDNSLESTEKRWIRPALIGAGVGAAGTAAYKGLKWVKNKITGRRGRRSVGEENELTDDSLQSPEKRWLLPAAAGAGAGAAIVHGFKWVKNKIGRRSVDEENELTDASLQSPEKRRFGKALAALTTLPFVYDGYKWVKGKIRGRNQPNLGRRSVGEENELTDASLQSPEKRWIKAVGPIALTAASFAPEIIRGAKKGINWVKGKINRGRNRGRRSVGEENELTDDPLQSPEKRWLLPAAAGAGAGAAIVHGFKWVKNKIGRRSVDEENELTDASLQSPEKRRFGKALAALTTLPFVYDGYKWVKGKIRGRNQPNLGRRSVGEEKELTDASLQSPEKRWIKAAAPIALTAASFAPEIIRGAKKGINWVKGKINRGRNRGRRSLDEENEDEEFIKRGMNRAFRGRGQRGHGMRQMRGKMMRMRKMRKAKAA